MTRLPLSIVAAVLLLLLLASLVDARPGCSEKEEAAMGESYQKCLNDVNERSHKEMSKIKSNSDYQVGRKETGGKMISFSVEILQLSLASSFHCMFQQVLA